MTLLNEKKEQIQQEALDVISRHARCGAGISMGVGKTLLGIKDMHRISREDPDARFMVVAPKKSIFESWKNALEEFGYEHLTDKITFSTYISLTKQSHDYRKIYLDECHNLLNRHSLWLDIYPGDILGLTGTPPRYKNSEKGYMVNRYCRIVYEYITDDAVEENILNDYKIIVHPVRLSEKKDHRVKTKKGGNFLTSEKDHYNYWSKKIDNSFNPKEKNMLRIMRMQGLMSYSSKEKYLKKLLEVVHEERKVIIFCNTQDQADRISSYSYHSSNPKSNDNLELFRSGKISRLSCVAQLSEGVNIPDLECGIIWHAFSNERKTSQRLGRMLRLSPEKQAVIHILMYENTIDEYWVKSALESFDSTKIFYTESLI